MVDYGVGKSFFPHLREKSAFYGFQANFYAGVNQVEYFDGIYVYSAPLLLGLRLNVLFVAIVTSFY